MTSTIVYIRSLVLAFLTIFVWEYTGRRQEITFRPSSFLTVIATFFQSIWETLGIYAAKISSFYTYLDFEDLVATFHDIFKPVFDIAVSPYYSVKGYVSEMSFYDHPYLITMGSVTLVGLLAFLVVRYSMVLRVSNWWSGRKTVVRRRSKDD